MLNLDHKASLVDDDSSLEQHGLICQMPDTVLLPTTIALPWSQRERAKDVLPHRCPHPRLCALLLLHRRKSSGSHKSHAHSYAVNSLLSSTNFMNDRHISSKRLSTSDSTKSVRVAAKSSNSFTTVPPFFRPLDS